MPASGVPEEKARLRRRARAVRAGLDRAAWSRALVATLRAWPRYRAARTVATYLAFGSEPDLAALAGDGPRLAAPRVLPGAGGLALHALEGPLVRHPLGMPEPGPDAPRVDPEEVDLVLVPGLAFDPAGGRLGHGAGHYDRILPRLRADAARVGATHPALLFDALPLEPHDVRMTHLLLPDRVQSTTAAAEASSQDG